MDVVLSSGGQSYAYHAVDRRLGVRVDVARLLVTRPRDVRLRGGEAGWGSGRAGRARD